MGKTNVDFNEVRDNVVVVASAGPYADHLTPLQRAPYHSIF